MKAGWRPTNPIHTPKKFNAERWREKKNILQAHTPRKKIHGEWRGWKKIHAYTKSPNPPPPLRS